jgi:hypothetical protein
MGKGAGKGECGEKGDFKTEKGKVAGKIAICVLVFESVATAANVYLTCCTCCLLPCGCCWCFAFLASGISGIVGAAVPACCQKNVQALHALISTAAIALAFRVVMTIIFSIWVHKFNVMLQNYDTCIAANTPPPYPYSLSYSRESYCAKTNLSFNNDAYYLDRSTVQFLHDVFATALFFAVSMAAVSIFGVAFGADGAIAEEAARDLEGGCQAEPAHGQVVQLQVQMVQPRVIQPQLQVQVVPQPTYAVAEAQDVKIAQARYSR